MLTRVAGMEGKGKKSRKGGEKSEAKAEEKGRDALPPGPGRATAEVKKGKPEGRTGKAEERWMKGLCDCCRENETGGRKGEDSKGKVIERSDWGEEGWREAGIQITAEGTGEADRGETSQKAGVKKGDNGEKKEDPILINAPKGPKRLPRFCNLCKIYGHGDLTCHLQGNAPTPGPSRYIKPFKTLLQRTTRRGLGATRGRADIPTKKEEGHAKRGITFKREEKPTPPRGELELELELVKSNPEPGRAEMGNKKTETEEEPRRDEPMSLELGLGRGEGGGNPGEKKGESKQQKEGEGGSEKAGTQILKIHLRGCRAPTTTSVKGKELEWKRRL